MSGTLAIAAVSAALKYLLLSLLPETVGLESIGDIEVSAVAPDKVAEDATGLNIFFFRASVNSGWAANALPSRNAAGAPIARPYLALDCSYILTAHAAKDFGAEMLLGYAMQVLHENPVLPRELIREALTSDLLVTVDTPLAMRDAIAAANLAEQVEQIKITPEYLSLDGLSQVWSTLQTPYRPACAYKASVVLIESRQAARSALPVRSYNVYPLPFRQPVVSDVIAADGPGTPIVTGKEIVVRGARLRGEDTRLRVAGGELAGNSLDVSDSEIRFALPAQAQAGVNSVQVAHYLALGTPPVPHRGVESNVAAFVLQPQIVLVGDEYQIAIVPPAGDTPPLLRVQVEPQVTATQRAGVLLNQFNPLPGQAAAAYAFDALPRAPGSPPTAQLDFPIPAVAPGEYLVRVRVDGAESPLEYTAPQGYDRPRVVVA